MSCNYREKLFLLHPNMVEMDLNSFIVNFNINGSLFRVHVTAPLFPSMEKSVVEVFQDLKYFDHQTDVLKFTDIFDFLKNLKVEFLLKCKNLRLNDEYLKKMGELIKQIHKLKYISSDDLKIFVKPDYSIIKFTEFKNNENHFLILRRDENSVNFKVLDHSLPELKSEMFKSYGSPESHLFEFKKYLEQFEEFYCNINTIDELCFVVDPIVYSTKSYTRTFKYNEKVYIKITVNPINPASPACEFIGPTNELEPLKAKYIAGIYDWDIDMDIYKNLLRIFEIMYFPMKLSSHEESLNNEQCCSICYTYRLKNQLPIITCDNEKCDVVYHTVCLNEWFSSLKDSKTFLKISFGTCPYCKGKISASFTQLASGWKLRI